MRKSTYVDTAIVETQHIDIAIFYRTTSVRERAWGQGYREPYSS